MQLFISIFIKFFFLLTPFFGLTMFMAMTKHMDAQGRRSTAVRTTCAVVVICLVLFFFGGALFEVLGITVDSFRIGAGSLLFLSAVSLVRGTKSAPEGDDGDPSVVPLAIPIIVGPASTGALLVMGAGPGRRAEARGQRRAGGRRALRGLPCSTSRSTCAALWAGWASRR